MRLISSLFTVQLFICFFLASIIDQSDSFLSYSRVSAYRRAVVPSYHARNLVKLSSLSSLQPGHTDAGLSPATIHRTESVSPSVLNSPNVHNDTSNDWEQLLTVVQSPAFQVVCITVLTHLFVDLFLFRTGRIPSNSMFPTFQVNDRIVVRRFNLVSWFLTSWLSPMILQRRDIVAFTLPTSKITLPHVVGGMNTFIKRVVGLPGDTIEIKKGIVYLNKLQQVDSYLATSAGGIIPADYSFSSLKIPPGHVFVLGDNRGNSLDSSVWGLLPIKNIWGRAVFRFWPFHRIGKVS